MTAPDIYRQSIFAYELERIAVQHALHLSEFGRKPLAFERRKVKELAESLHTVERLPGLNHAEIMSMVYGLKLSQEERRRIYASLIALGVQRLMLSYLTDGFGGRARAVTEDDCERAWKIAEEVREIALIWLEQRQKDGDEIFRGIGGPGIMPPIVSGSSNSVIVPQMTAALRAYDEGVALAAIGQMDESGGESQMFLAQAEAQLSLALKTLEQLSPSLRATGEWTYWYQEVKKALASAQQASGDL